MILNLINLKEHIKNFELRTLHYNERNIYALIIKRTFNHKLTKPNSIQKVIFYRPYWPVSAIVILSENEGFVKLLVIITNFLVQLLTLYLKFPEIIGR